MVIIFQLNGWSNNFSINISIWNDACNGKTTSKFSSECTSNKEEKNLYITSTNTKSLLQEGDKLSVYLEYVSGGSIHKLLSEYGPFTETVIQSYTKQILAGLAYLHGRNTVHRYLVIVIIFLLMGSCCNCFDCLSRTTL